MEKFTWKTETGWVWFSETTTTKDTWTEIWGNRGGVDAEDIDTKYFWVLKQYSKSWILNTKIRILGQINCLYQNFNF